MQFKLLISIALIVVLVGVALAWRSATVAFQSSEAATIKVVINQPPAKDGVIPIEIIRIGGQRIQLNRNVMYEWVENPEQTLATAITNNLGKVIYRSVYCLN